MASIKKVAQNSLFYTLSNLLLRASSIIFFPIFSFYLTKEDYGILSITQSIVAVITTISSLEIGKAIARFTYDDTHKVDRNSILINGMLTVLVSNAIWVSLLLVIGGYVLKPVLNDIEFYPYMFYSLLSMIFTCIVGVYVSYLKANHEGQKSFWFELFYYGTNILLNFVFVVFFKTNVIGLILSTLVSGIIYAGFIFLKGVDYRKAKLNYPLIRSFLSYSLPLVPFSLLGFLLENTDKFMLNSFWGAEINGLYYLAFTLGSLFATVKESLYSSFTPWFFQHFKKENYKNILHTLNYIFVGSGILAIGISFFSFEVMFILSSNKDFVEVWKYVPFVTSGLFIVFIGQIISLPVFHAKKTKYFFFSNLGGLIVTAISSYFLIQSIQIYGALLAKVIGYIVMVIIQYLFAIHYSDFRVNVFRLVILIIGISIVSFIHYLPINYFLLLPLKIVIATTIVILYILFLKRSFFPGISIMELVKIKVLKRK